MSAIRSLAMTHPCGTCGAVARAECVEIGGETPQPWAQGESWHDTRIRLSAAPAAERWYRLIAGAEPLILFSFDVVPVAKERARAGARGRHYTPEKTRAAEEHLAWRFKLALKGRVLEGNLGIVCVFYRPNRQRIDGDNMLKLVCDAGNEARAWGDDCQLTTKLARVELDKARPRTEIAIGPMPSTLAR